MNSKDYRIDMRNRPADDETIEIKIIRLRQLLRRTEEAIQAARQEELRRYQITPENAAVLHIITDLDGSAKSNEISRWLQRRQHSVHELLDRMEKAGLVNKVEDPTRKNGTRFILSNKGKELYKQTRKITGPRQIFSVLSEKELEQFSSYLHRLLEKARAQAGTTEEVLLGPPVRK